VGDTAHWNYMLADQKRQCSFIPEFMIQPQDNRTPVHCDWCDMLGTQYTAGTRGSQN